MKTRWKDLRSKHWNGRPVQEKKIIILASTILIPVIFYFFLWQPAHSAVTKLRNTLPILQAQSIKMNNQASEVDSLRHRPVLAALDSVSLKSSIIDSATRHQVYNSITYLDATKANGVRITSDEISFSALISWLHDLEIEQHIRPDSISISALPQSGMVKINATLTNGIVP